MKNSAIISLDTAPTEVNDAIKALKKAVGQMEAIGVKLTEAEQKRAALNQEHVKAFAEVNALDEALTAAIKKWGKA